jgi:hypothetical protein
MPSHTTCTKCGCVYEAGSEEQANERSRWCPSCRICTDCEERGGPLGVCGVDHGPLCQACVKIHNDRHAEETKRDIRDPKTWGDLERGER